MNSPHNHLVRYMRLLFHLRQRKAEQLAQGHTANTGQSWDLNAGSVKAESVQGNHYAVPVSLLGLLPFFHPAVNFSNSDRRREKDSFSLSYNWTQGLGSLPSQLIFLFWELGGSGKSRV